LSPSSVSGDAQAGVALRILFGKTFGLGNAVCAVPAIKALQTLGDVDLLVGNSPDDFGAIEVLAGLVASRGGKVHVNEAWVGGRYDVAIMSIPFDGRWRRQSRPFDYTGHFYADKVLDGRARPNNSQTLGFSSWEKHEVEYQMENVYELGYKGEIPDCSFTMKFGRLPDNSVYVGMGHKRDPQGFWSQKHWGNMNFACLIKLLLQDDPKRHIYTTGNIQDYRESLLPVMELVADERFHINVGNLPGAFGTIGSCDHYVGNDTGMAHVAASMDKNVAVVYKMDNAWTKSRPWCRNYRVIKSVEREVSPEEVLQQFKEMVNGKAS
jgi:ADP-heptose:LPS heptosyltransferase